MIASSSEEAVLPLLELALVVDVTFLEDLVNVAVAVAVVCDCLGVVA
jgi:hypothetical protein